MALDKAIESSDSDLILHVLLHLKKKLPLASFFRIINSRPLATALIESSASMEDASLLKDLYYQDDRRVDGANVFLRESLQQTDTRTAIDKLALASKVLSDSKETAFERQALSEATALLKTQEQISKELNELCVGLSLNETLYKLFLASQHPRAKKLAHDFKVPDKTYWWTRLRALVAARNWRELEDIASKNKKSPIGWQAFFEAIAKAGNLKLAGNVFVPKCVQEGRLADGEAARMWERCGMRVRAAEEAVKRNDRAAWDRLRTETEVGSEERSEIERLGANLKR